MAEGKLSVEIYSPERDKIALEAEEVVVPGAAGVLSVRPGHTPLLTNLSAGVVLVQKAEGEESFFSVHGGFAEVRGDRISVLSTAYEASEEIDADRARAAQERAEGRLNKPSEDTDLLRAEAALKRSLARLGARERKMF